MKCPECGSECPGGSTFCLSCGARMAGAGAAGPGSGQGTAAHPSRPDPGAEATRTLDMDAIAGILVPGTLFAGRYQVIEELGRGGMGCVYRVLDKKLKEEVALKFINPEIAAQKRVLDRFSHELKTARKIVHKNVGRVFDLEEHDGLHFISMEYVQGENLKSLLLRAGPLSLGKTLKIAAQVCAGMAEAHNLGIVHRDLKSQNIMIDQRGNARILDFGIALTPETGRGTATARVVGTPEAMSPEQAVGGAVDRRSDIYSLGIILYQMVTGELPFTGETPLEIVMKQKSEPPPDPRSINRQIPESLSRLILKCLDKDPARRFQDVRDIIAELERIGLDHGITGGLEGESSTGHRSGTVTRPSRIFQKKIAIPAAALLPVAILAMAGLAAYWFLLGPGRHKPETNWKTSVAVLPIRTPPDMESFRESLAGDIISELSRILTGVRIIPSHSMWLYRDTQKSLKQIGDELKADYVLQLILRPAGETFLVIAELSSVKDDAVRDSWRDNYAAISEIQEKLPSALSGKLRLSLAGPGQKAIPGESYLAYLNGWNAEKQFRNSGDPGSKDFANALSLYRAALKGCPEYAKAYVGIGNLYQLRFFYPGGKRDAGDFENMKKAYERAYSIDPRLPEANIGLGWMCFFKEDLTSADKYYREALRLAPNNAEALFNFASFLRDIGLFEQAIPLFQKACEMDPVWMEYVNQMARCRMFNGDFEGAMNDVLAGLTKEPGNGELRALLARLLILAGRLDRATVEIEALEKSNPANPALLRLRSLLAAVQGKRAEALDLLKGRDPILYSSCLSLVYAALGMNDEAVTNIAEVINHGFEPLGTYLYTYLYLKTCPFYQRLGDDPRFQLILGNAEREYLKNLKLYGGRAIEP